MEEQPIFMDEEEAKQRYTEFEVDPNFAIREEENDDDSDYESEENQDDSDAEPSPNRTNNSLDNQYNVGQNDNKKRDLGAMGKSEVVESQDVYFDCESPSKL